MLFETNSLKRLAAAALMAFGCAGQALAEDAPAADAASSYVPYLDTSKLTKEQLDEGRRIGEGIVRDILDAYETKRTPEMEQEAARAKRRVDSIADEVMAAERDKVMDFLGIDPAATTGLFFFVSWSMPLEMLRSYAIEAMWSGGTLVFRGIPPGKDLAQFITQDLRQLVYGKGAAANISIDPRLFDTYKVQSVPTIVFTTVRNDLQCTGILVSVKLDEGRQGSYDGCPQMDPALFWSVSGAVTTNYALQTFIEDGALAAKPYLAALAKGWAGKAAPAKEQRSFVGSWEDALSPTEKMVAKETLEAITRAPAAKP